MHPQGIHKAVRCDSLTPFWGCPPTFPGRVAPSTRDLGHRQRCAGPKAEVAAAAGAGD